MYKLKLISGRLQYDFEEPELSSFPTSRTFAVSCSHLVCLADHTVRPQIMIALWQERIRDCVPKWATESGANNDKSYAAAVWSKAARPQALYTNP